MADAVDDDTLQGVLAAWKADRTLSALFPLPPATGRIKSTQPGQDVQASGPTAVIDCAQGPRPNERFAQGGAVLVRNDYRKVTITLRGTRADVVAGVKGVLATFNRALGTSSGAPFSLPSGARFIRWWPLNDGEIKEDDSTKAGRDVWQGIVLGEVWTIRTEGAEVLPPSPPEIGGLTGTLGSSAGQTELEEDGFTGVIGG